MQRLVDFYETTATEQSERVCVNGAPARHLGSKILYWGSETTSPPKQSGIQRRPRFPAIHIIISKLLITFHRCLSDINQCYDVDRLGRLAVSDTLSIFLEALEKKETSVEKNSYHSST
ncbi:hypothetical protein Y032_0093g2617 [Ancylostoma ceylanicum]|uniref:Uncharacterized protein n=1 Tax=Ancylostoma ceylanicum TaxID=53326 RepID=A0A016TLG2_9BILA|nr:hypothetical protein Y032_0093g2617 [Ancylostoma ceylanicum]